MTLLKDSAASFLTLIEQAADPANPASGQVKLYAKTDCTLIFVDELGVTHVLIESADVHAAVTIGTDVDAVFGLSAQYLTLDTQTANTVFAGPTTGAAADPTFRALVQADLPTNYEALNLIIDGGGSAITTGVKADIDFEDDYSIAAWRILPDQSGYLTVDLWVDTWANYPPTDADSITNGHEPALDGLAKAEDTDLADWSDTTIAAGQTMRVNVDSASTVTRATLALKLLRT